MARAVLQTGFVVIGRNEGERLVRCIHSLRKTGLPIVYVDSCSTDGSADVAASLGATVVSLEGNKALTAARARAEGAATVQAQYPGIEAIMFIDGDCELETSFLADALEEMTDNCDVAAVCGRRRERFPEASRYNRLIDSEWDTPVGEAEACGGDALIRLESYQQVGGFSPDMLAGEEPELCFRLRGKGWRVVRIDAEMTTHDAAILHVSQWWHRAVRSGMGYAQAWTKTRIGPGGGLYAREIRRAVVWAGLIPILAIGLALAYSPFFLAAWPLAAIAQLIRLAPKIGAFPALLLSVGKYAELLGIVRFGWRAVVRSQSDAVTYK